MGYPQVQMRRLRTSELIRSMVQETRLSPADFVMPLFICPGNGVKAPVGSMPGVYRMSIDNILSECRRIRNLGIRAVLLFGIPESKDEPEKLVQIKRQVQQAIGAIKSEFMMIFGNNRCLQL